MRKNGRDGVSEVSILESNRIPTDHFQRFGVAKAESMEPFRSVADLWADLWVDLWVDVPKFGGKYEDYESTKFRGCN